jgi:hypothetical protein
MAAKRTSVPADKLELYERLVAAVDGAELKSNFGSAYTAVNGNMYSMISKYGVLGIRLPADDRAAFLEAFNTTIFRADPSWPPAKEYVSVPDALLADTETLRPYLQRGLRYAQGLRPKPTKPTKPTKPGKPTEPTKRKPAKPASQQSLRGNQ